MGRLLAGAGDVFATGFAPLDFGAGVGFAAIGRGATEGAALGRFTSLAASGFGVVGRTPVVLAPPGRGTGMLARGTGMLGRLVAAEGAGLTRAFGDAMGPNGCNERSFEQVVVLRVRRT